MIWSTRVAGPKTLPRSTPIAVCSCCGGEEFVSHAVLWKDLVREWRISCDETDYINRQQGTLCKGCGSNLRSCALAIAVMRTYRFSGIFSDWVRSAEAQRLSVLELNGAGNLTGFLRAVPGHIEKSYPEVDMLSMPFPNQSFDLVLHSDTLEHVPDPVRGLAECRRILRPGGACCFTVPIIPARLTRSRDGMAGSFHGGPGDRKKDYLVHTEYGADAWRHVIEAGFSECRIISAEYPSALALVAIP
jgi:SAM-dependent methyltransferase